ncbi:hypothetical protein BH20VER3_BH20VER3_02600 [soil metagenome]
MKVLFSCGLPFFLAHGGAQTLTEELMLGLQGLGVEVEPARWWDEDQKGDILHFIGRPSTLNVRLAHKKGFKVIMTDLLDQTASRSGSRLFLQRTITRLIKNFVPKFTGQLNWEVYRELDAMVYAVPHEREVAKYLFNARADRGHVIPHGLEENVIADLRQPQPQEDYLISVATIDPRKNALLLAQAAHRAKVPIVFLGKPYSVESSYLRQFQDRVDDVYVRYPGFVAEAEKRRYLRSARGFVLLSQFESGCIAVFEAAAAGLPLLLSDLPWATKGYPCNHHMSFVKLAHNVEGLASSLKAFHEHARRQANPIFPILSWRQVAQKYLKVYESVMRS